LTQKGSIQGGPSATLSVLDGTENFGLVEGFNSIQGRLVNRGHLHPGFSPGTLLLEDGYTHGVDGVLDIELEGTARFDRLVVDGTAELLGGELALHCYGLCELHEGDRFDFIETTELTGVFDSVTLPGFGEGWLFDVDYDYDADRASLEVLQVGARVSEPGALLLTALALVATLLTRARADAVP
jgi:hypothetical protein